VQLLSFAAYDLNSASGLNLFTYCVRTVLAILVWILFLLVRSFLDVCIFVQKSTYARQETFEHRLKTMLPKVPFYAKRCSLVPSH